MLLTLALLVAQAPYDRAAKWEKEIAGIEKRLTEKPPAAGGLLFAGSSSIRLWKLDDSFPDLHPINVGFGGSQVRDCTHFVKRLIVPHKPATVVFYAGDNDIADKRTAEQVRDDTKAFVAAVHADLPKARILFLPVKPSPKRWALYDTQTAANRMVKELAATDARLGYIDTVPALMGTDGKPDPSYFKEDILHLNAKGYAKWAPLVRAALK